MKWTVGTKIATGFGVVAAIFLIVGIVSYRSTAELTDTIRLLSHTHVVERGLNELIQSLTDAETAQRGFVITTEPRYLDPYKAGVAKAHSDLAALRELIQAADQARRLDQLETLVNKRIDSLQRGIDESTTDPQAGRQWIQRGEGTLEMGDVRRLIGEMEEVQSKRLDERSGQAENSAWQTKLTIVLGTLVALMVAAVAGFSITRNIATPLKSITSAAQRIAEGDLDVKVAGSGRSDEVGILASTFAAMTSAMRKMASVAARIAEGDLRVNVTPQSDRDLLGNSFATMVERLRQLTSQISESVNAVSSSTNQISTSTSQLASSAAQTAVAVTETTTTVEEVRQTAQVTTDKSKHVSENAQRVTETAQVGRTATEAMLDGMQRIRQQMDLVADSMVRLSQQAQAVGQIIATVDDLSAQANLLAVNAAIEASRAGEHGKGFSVVAQEVRSLAEQSKQGTSQVRSILNDIQSATSAAVMATEQSSKAVEDGIRQSGEAGEAIQALANSVEEAAQAATQIAASSQQQLVGMDQVATAMESIKQASDQNAASAQQLQAAATNLRDVGQALRNTVAAYKV